MTDYEFGDVGEPGDVKSALRASDLINLPLLVRVTGEGEWPAKDAHTDEQGRQIRAQGPTPYVECDVVVLGAGGIEDHGSGVRISWRRVVPAQLSMQKLGQWIPCRPKQMDDRSVVLMGFDEKGKARAAELMPEIELLFPRPHLEQAVQAIGAAFNAGEEPF